MKSFLADDLPKNAHYSEELSNSPHLCELPNVCRVDQSNTNVVWENGQQVNHVHDTFHEFDLTWA